MSTVTSTRSVMSSEVFMLESGKMSLLLLASRTPNWVLLSPRAALSSTLWTEAFLVWRRTTMTYHTAHSTHCHELMPPSPYAYMSMLWLDMFMLCSHLQWQDELFLHT